MQAANRAPRYSFVATVELWELDSEKHLSAQITNLNLLGCFVETPTPFPEGTKLRLSVTRGSMNFVAIGRVAHSQPDSGMGVAFVTIESTSMPVIDRWLEKLRK